MSKLKRTGNGMSGKQMQEEMDRLDANRPLNPYTGDFEQWSKFNNDTDEKLRVWKQARERYFGGLGPDPGPHPFAHVTRGGGGSRRRRSSRKVKKSSKRVFRKKSRSTRRR
jgi:hypothetical protein